MCVFRCHPLALDVYELTNKSNVDFLALKDEGGDTIGILRMIQFDKLIIKARNWLSFR